MYFCLAETIHSASLSWQLIVCNAVKSGYLVGHPITPMTTITRKAKIRFFIPFAIVGLLLLYTCAVFITDEYQPAVPHFLGLAIYAVMAILRFRSTGFKPAIVILGIYLVMATINLVVFTPGIVTSTVGLGIGSMKIYTPDFNGFSFLILIIYGILNFDFLVELYLDYKQSKGKL